MADPISGYTLAQNNIDLSSATQNNSISYANVSDVKPLSEYVNGNASITNQSPTSSPLPPKGNGPLRYPNALLDNTSDWLEIKIVKYKPPGFNTQSGTLRFGTATESIRNKQSGSLQSVVQYIHLPIPKQLADGNSVDWGADRLNPLSGLGAQAVEGLIKNPGDITKILQNAYTTAVNATKSGEGQGSVISAASQQVLNSLGANVSASSILGRSTGTAVNPNLELLFNSVNLREFNFTFDFAPRDSYESQTVKQIIKSFKKAMSPKTNLASGAGIGLLVAAPDVFEIKYKSGSADHPFLNAFKTCALLDMRLDYTASGNYSTYSDGTPVHISMALTFKELNPVYAEDYDTAESGPGVGY